ncbi:hypothetical protein GY45DRAFT_258330 [Cubamyces sp. BRFM 1775]|nr:hypothetical protein GY45DRAFT_258330 [Cubamyces sp. BRFM 1775]
MHHCSKPEAHRALYRSRSAQWNGACALGRVGCALRVDVNRHRQTMGRRSASSPIGLLEDPWRDPPGTQSGGPSTTYGMTSISSADDAHATPKRVVRCVPASGSLHQSGTWRPPRRAVPRRSSANGQTVTAVASARAVRPDGAGGWDTTEEQVNAIAPGCHLLRGRSCSVFIQSQYCSHPGFAAVCISADGAGRNTALKKGLQREHLQIIGISLLEHAALAVCTLRRRRTLTLYIGDFAGQTCSWQIATAAARVHPSAQLSRLQQDR